MSLASGDLVETKRDVVSAEGRAVSQNVRLRAVLDEVGSLSFEDGLGRVFPGIDVTALLHVGDVAALDPLTYNELVLSAATPEDIDLYSSGLCHVFAEALHRRTGWPIRLYLSDEVYSEFEDGTEISGVIHAAVIAPDDTVWDALGIRPDSLAVQEFNHRFCTKVYDTDTLSSDDELRAYSGCWGEPGEEEVDRPLVAISEHDIQAAEIAVQEALGKLLERYDNRPSPQ